MSTVDAAAVERLLAEALRGHQPNNGQCKCGWKPSEADRGRYWQTVVREHVASEQAAALAPLLPQAQPDDEAVRALSDEVNAFSALLDGTYPPGLDAETHRWRRVAKVSEEVGEVIEALLGSVSENPRKGASHTLQDVYKELLDVAFCALAACAHLSHNRGDAVSDLTGHARATHARLHAALSSPAPADRDAEVKAATLREFAKSERAHMAAAWGADRSWLTTGTHVADLVAEWITEHAEDMERAHLDRLTQGDTA